MTTRGYPAGQGSVIIPFPSRRRPRHLLVPSARIAHESAASLIQSSVTTACLKSLSNAPRRQSSLRCQRNGSQSIDDLQGTVTTHDVSNIQERRKHDITSQRAKQLARLPPSKNTEGYFPLATTPIISSPGTRNLQRPIRTTAANSQGTSGGIYLLNDYRGSRP